ncbi:MAG: tetratricopeptide repeat protein [Ferruginibacter sp.]|nr:tetratricopeptide repeat protein [Ferruginibacter sp.]
MKKLYVILTLILLNAIALKSQTIDDARKDVYYAKYKSAKNILQSTLSNDKASPYAWYWLMEVYLKEKNIDSANKIASTIPAPLLEQRSMKDNPLVFIGRAHVLLDSGLTTEARSQMDEVLKAGKYKNPVALLAAARANIESKNGDVPWALELLGQAVKKDKKNAEIYTAIGDAYFRMTDGGKAIINYDQAIALNPSYAEPMYKTGVIYKTQKNKEIYLEKFTKAYEMDSAYLPALYELYYYYYFTDVVKANQFLNAYIRHADADPMHGYMITDLQYVSKKYKEAIAGADSILMAEGSEAQPRLYKLVAYSKAALGDSTAALQYMNTYFDKQDTAQIVAKDYELKANLLEKLSPDKAEAIVWYRKALAADSNKNEKLNYMIALANIQQELGNRERESVWRERVYENKKSPTNLDIYKWGMALYSAENFEKADSVFALYESKYPDKVHGYLWRARSNASIDTTMEKGLAVPHYKGLVEVAIKDSVKNKPLLLRAYQYLGAYEANVTKDYAASLEYYSKILSLNPEDTEADKNAKILEKWIKDGKGNN